VTPWGSNLAMAKLQDRRAENVGGDFYVDASCIDCDLCRSIAPETYARVGDQSAVVHQPQSREDSFRALQALVTCPTSSIGTRARHAVQRAATSYPEPIDDGVYFCGFAAEASFGASSYLIVRSDGNVLVDSPRYASLLARGIDALGGVRTIFLTHRDDIADHARWARRFGAERVLHAADQTRATRNVEHTVHGTEPVELRPGLRVIPTPGHRRGHACLLLDERYLFAGDHLWWSPRQGRVIASPDVCWYSWREQLRSVERLLQHRFEWILPGHGRRFHAPVEEMHAQLRNILSAAR